MLNQTRLKVYPRLILITVWTVMLVNLVLQADVFIGYDYLIFYAGGKLYQKDTAQLYNPQALSDQSAQFVPDSDIFIRNIYLNPPYYALFFTLINNIPYEVSLAIWIMLSILALLGSFYIMVKVFISEKLVRAGLSFGQLTVIGLSMFPVVYGIRSAQNHTFTLFFLVLVLMFMKQERWAAAGLAAGLLIYKPQFILGFLIVWFIWRKWKALLSFGVVLGSACLAVYIPHGIQPFLDYLHALQYVWLYPFDEVGKIEMSIYSLFVHFFDLNSFDIIRLFSQVLGFVALILVIVIAYKSKPVSWRSMTLPILACLLFPFYSSPHVLFYEIPVLFLVFILWANLSSTHILLWTVVGVYIGCLFLPLLAVLAGISIMGLIPLGVTLCLVVDLYRQPGLKLLE